MDCRGAGVGVAVACIVAGGCGDSPYEIEWSTGADTVVLYSITHPVLNLANAFDFVDVTPVLVEAPGATGNWDVAVGGDEDGLTLLPPRSLGIGEDVGIAVLPQLLEEVTMAPEDSTAYQWAEPVPLSTGTTYVIRTRQAYDNYGSLCVFFAKMEPLSIDLANLRVRFIYGANPNCGDRRLDS